MDWLTFTTKMFEALAWPIVALAIASMFRREILGLIPLIKKFKAGPLEAEFERVVKETTAKAAALEDVPPPALPEVAFPGPVGSGMSPLPTPLDKENRPPAPVIPIEPGDDLNEFFSRPSFAIPAAWRNIEAALLQLISAANVPYAPMPRSSSRTAVAAVKSNRLLSSDTLEVVEQMLALRDRIVHTRDLEPAQQTADEYITSSRRLIDLIRSATKYAESSHSAKRPT